MSRNVYKELMGDEFKCIKKDLDSMYNDLITEVTNLRQELETYNKDAEIARRDNEISSLMNRSLFIMSEKEKKAYDKFFKEHYSKHLKEKYGTTKIVMKNPLPEWKHIIELTGTGVGTGIDVVCPICGERKDITDFSNW